MNISQCNNILLSKLITVFYSFAVIVHLWSYCYDNHLCYTGDGVARIITIVIQDKFVLRLDLLILFLIESAAFIFAPV